MWIFLVVAISALFCSVSAEIVPMPSNITSNITSNRTCEQGWKEFNGHCYWFSDSTHGFFRLKEAEKLCCSKESQIVSIHSQDENKFVRDTMVNTWPSNGAFIGYRCQDDDGWWTDGSLVDYKNMKTDQCPLQPTAFFIHSTEAVGDYGKWQVSKLGGDARVICKKPL